MKQSIGATAYAYSPDGRAQHLELLARVPAYVLDELPSVTGSRRRLALTAAEAMALQARSPWAFVPK